jgi:hypothetical protein
MPTRRGPDNSVRIAISGNWNSKPWANVFHCQLTTSGSISQADLDTWTVAFANQYKTSFAPRMQTAVNYSLATATLYTPGGGVLSSQQTMTGNGSNGGTAVTDNAAAKCISWLSTVFWRGGKPRTYITGPTTGDITAGTQISAAEITALTTAATGFRTAINALTATSITGTVLGFVSFFTGNTLRTPPVFYSFTGAKVHTRLATQRRRLGKWTP